MREIKFRGQRIDTKEWVYGNLVSSSYLPDNILECFIVTCFAGGKELGIIESFKVIPKSVSKFIGLKDKKGKEIYNRDIVEWVTKTRDNKEKGIISQNDDGTWLINKCFKVYNQKEQIKVIGNIDENPKLLKKVEKWLKD